MTRTRRRPRQAGFTLVEMMIALLLFTFAVAGVLSVAVSMASGFHEQREAAATETSVRNPMDFLADAIRLASPAVPSGNIQDVLTCTVGAISVINSTVGPDQIDVTYAYGSSITSLQTTYDVGTTSITVTNDSTPAQASQIFVGDTLLITNFTQGHLVHVAAVNPATGVITLDPQGCAVSMPAGGYLPGSLVIRALRARFSVGAVDGIPTLMMDPDADGPIDAAGPDPLAEGIEDMQVAVGVDVNGNGSIDAGEWAFAAGTGALVGPIRAVRITLTSRSSTQLVAGTVNSTLAAAEDRPAIITAGDFRRRVLTSTIEVRNLVGSP